MTKRTRSLLLETNVVFRMSFRLSFVGRILIGFLLFLIAMPVMAGETPPFETWQSPHFRDHGLVGKIWSTGTGTFIPAGDLAETLATRDLVLIGETHDNGDHHQLQAWLIGRIADGRRPAVVMEMIASDRQQALDAYRAKPEADAAGLGAALSWHSSGWPDWPLYRPIGEAVFDHGLALRSGVPPRETVRAVSRRGLDALPAGETQRLTLDRPLPAPLAKDLAVEIKAAHCDLMPDSAIAPMTKVQTLRDAAMADAMLASRDGDGAILIAGNDHVRKDRGVPFFLKRRAADKSIATVMLVEIEHATDTVESLAVSDKDGKPAADFVWFTPRAEREDQCDLLRQRFKKRSK